MSITKRRKQGKTKEDEKKRKRKTEGKGDKGEREKRKLMKEQSERVQWSNQLQSRCTKNQTGKKKGEMNNPAQKPGGIFSYFCQGCVTGSDLDHRRLVDRSQK